jgi:hypothetical protein
MGVLAVFDEQGQWGDTHVCDALIAQHLASVGVIWGPQGSAAPAVAVDEGMRLFYFRVDAGHLGVLCESGEWIGFAPVTVEGPSLGESLQTPPGLPALAEFIDTMLVLMGHAEAED